MMMMTRMMIEAAINVIAFAATMLPCLPCPIKLRHIKAEIIFGKLAVTIS